MKIIKALLATVSILYPPVVFGLDIVTGFSSPTVHTLSAIAGIEVGIVVVGVIFFAVYDFLNYHE